MYTRAFGKYGNATNPYVKKQLKHLDRALEKANIMPVPGLFLQAVYTRPGHGRQRDEVMRLEEEWTRIVDPTEPSPYIISTTYEIETVIYGAV